MRTTVLLAIFVCTFFNQGIAQTIDPAIYENYSPEIVSRLYQVVNKTGISSSQQFAIATIFKKQDSAITELLRQNQNQVIIDSVYASYQSQWRSVLSTTEEFYFNTETQAEIKELRYSYALISLALKRQSEIDFPSPIRDFLLSKIDSLKIQETDFLALHPTDYFNSTRQQNRYINLVLNDEQYGKFNEFRNQRKAEFLAKRDWEELNQRGLAVGLNESEVLQQFITFHSAKSYAYGRYQDNEKERKKYLQTLYNNESPAGKKLYYARKFQNTATSNYKPTDYSQFLLAIKLSDKLVLSDDQVKRLLSKASDLKIAKDSAYAADSTRPYDGRVFECIYLKQILMPEQYEMYLVNKNVNKAKVFALNDWRELTQRNLTATFQKDSTITELTGYYIVRLSTIDRYEDDKIKQNDLLKELSEHIPNALNTLLHARRNPDNNTQTGNYQW